MSPARKKTTTATKAKAKAPAGVKKRGARDQQEEQVQKVQELKENTKHQIQKVKKNLEMLIVTCRVYWFQVVVEHCTSWQVFKKRAREMVATLSSAPKAWKMQDQEELQLQSEFNPGSEKPKRGSFEIHLLLENDEKVLIWSGLKRGPPRREKFPDADTLLQAAQKALL